jgi:hypothetical protein
MNRSIRASLGTVAGVALLASMVGGPASNAGAQNRSGSVQQANRTDRCCYNNFRFSGTCVVTIGERETCSDPLAYLNNFQSVGRQYCGNTTIRGGWSLVSCDSATAGAGGSFSPSYITPVAPSYTEPVREETVRPTPTSTAPTQSPSFITPVDSKSSVQASEPGLISL